MRAIRFHEYGGPDVLQVEEVPRPDPGADEVLVAAEAIGVNPTEVYSRTGHRDHELPRIPGADVAGTVTAVGEYVDDVKTGDRVFATALQNDRQGSYAEYVPVRADRLAHVPDGVRIEQCAAVGVVGVTAWRTFVDIAGLSPADVCLIHGGSGGVGHVAVQIAALVGATVVATAGSDAARDEVRRLGADHVFDYNRPDLAKAVDATLPRGVDVVLDHRLGEYLQLDVGVGADGVTIVGLGRASDRPTLENLWQALEKEATLRVSSMSNTSDVSGVLDTVGRLIARGDLRVEVARTYELEAGAAAQRALEDDHFVGKLLLRP